MSANEIKEMSIIKEVESRLIDEGITSNHVHYLMLAAIRRRPTAYDKKIIGEINHAREVEQSVRVAMA